MSYRHFRGLLIFLITSANSNTCLRDERERSGGDVVQDIRFWVRGHYLRIGTRAERVNTNSCLRGSIARRR